MSIKELTIDKHYQVKTGMENPGNIADLTSSSGGQKLRNWDLTRSWDTKGLHHVGVGEGKPEPYQSSSGITAHVQADWVNQGISSLELA